MKYVGFILLAVIVAIIIVLLLIAVLRTLLMPVEDFDLCGRRTGGGSAGTGRETVENDPI